MCDNMFTTIIDVPTKEHLHNKYESCSVNEGYEYHYSANIIICGWRNHKVRQKYQEIYKLETSKYLQEDIMAFFKVRMKYPFKVIDYYDMDKDIELVAAQSNVSKYEAYKALYINEFDIVNAIMALTM